MEGRAGQRPGEQGLADEGGVTGRENENRDQGPEDHHPIRDPKKKQNIDQNMLQEK